MFSECSSLNFVVTNSFVIHEKVSDIGGAFVGCTSLTGTVKINEANLVNYTGCFSACDMSKITLNSIGLK